MLTHSLDVSTKRLYTRHIVESSKRMAGMPPPQK